MNIELFSFSGLLCCLAFFFAGVVDSITGGGGLITLPFAVLGSYIGARLNLVSATGNTRFVIAIASVTSVFTYAASGAVLWKLAAAATVFNIVGSYLGAALAVKNGARIIRPIMLCVTAFLVFKLIADIV